MKATRSRDLPFAGVSQTEPFGAGLPDHVPMVSLGDAYSHGDEWVGSLADTIAAGGTPDSPELAVIEAIKAERPFLTPLQTAIADWMLGLFSGTEERSQGQLADDLGKTEGYVSKQRKQVEEKVKKRNFGQNAWHIWAQGKKGLLK
jgi:hypothetical protein